MNRDHAPEPRNPYGFPVAQKPGEMPITMLDAEPILPAWAWFFGVLVMAMLAAWVMA
jgi:hypothetical protein